MIYRSIQIIGNELNRYYEDNYGNTGAKFAMIDNIAHADGGGGAGAGDSKLSVMITLVNTEEEKTLKNQSVYIREGEQMKKTKPLIYLNLFLLFACADDAYEEALKKIDIVAEFFQHHYVFTPGAGRVDRITVEMVSLSLEQQNHIWGMLGGKQAPSLMYKLRLAIIDKAKADDVEVVRTIGIEPGKFPAPSPV